MYVLLVDVSGKLVCVLVGVEGSDVFGVLVGLFGMLLVGVYYLVEEGVVLDV